MMPEKMESLDRILGSDEDIAPSSGFVSAVMERLREEAAAPEPIPFPWKRVLPGAIVVATGLLWCVVQLVQMGIAEAKTSVWITWHPAELTTPRVESAAGVAVALAVSLLSWLLARRLIGRRGPV